MVAGHLQEKKGYFYMVLNLKDEKGSRKPKWIPTGLPVKGNKRKAEAMLQLERQKYTSPVMSPIAHMLFSDYMLYWLRVIKPDVEENTFSGYEMVVKRRINPYFAPLGIRLSELKAIHIQEFYLFCKKEYKVKNNTIIHYHANLSHALKYATEMEIIPKNPMNQVKRPRPEQHTPSFYTLAETEHLIKLVHGDKIEFAVLMAAFYGLRRSEIIGLQWKAIDFESNRITINHTVVQTLVDGKMQILSKDRTKNKSSCRSLPLVPAFRKYLLQQKKLQEEQKQLCGNSYIETDYVYVNDIGQPIKPDFVTTHFALVMKKYNLRKITFHELRHSCASLLLKNGVSMKEIQAWLGHSTYNTTATFYAHLDAASNEQVGKTMADTLDISSALKPFDATVPIQA